MPRFVNTKNVLRNELSKYIVEEPCLKVADVAKELRDVLTEAVVGAFKDSLQDPAYEEALVDALGQQLLRKCFDVSHG